MAAIGLPTQAAAGNTPPSLPSAGFVSMEVREGRIGNAFACERCRKHKVRCVPSDIAGVCQRCQKARVECIEHVARRRPAKPRVAGQTPSRVAEMEKKLDKLSAMVIATPSPASATTPPFTQLPANTLHSQPTDPVEQVPIPTSAGSAPPVRPVAQGPILPNPGSTPETTTSFWDSIDESICGLGPLDPVVRSISITHMQTLLESYRAMVDFFPFVPLPKQCFCQDLLQRRPVLMLAVLTAASRDSGSLQMTLSREVRKMIMMQIMKGERSLDLLQGLLVFIAWHHHYMEQQAVSVSMLLQICVGITIDLKLDALPLARTKDHMQDREAKRAFLGCYFLTTHMVVVHGSHSQAMSHSSALHEYAADLAAAWEFKTDTVLPSLLAHCQFLRDTEISFQSPAEEALSARTQARRLEEQWDNARQASKKVPVDSKVLDWAQLAGRVYMFRSASSVELLNRGGAPWVSGFQLSLRVSYISAIEQFLEASTHLSASHFEYLSIVDWLNLISILTSLGKLALSTGPLPGWDPADLQVRKIFEHFRDRVCARLPRPRDNNEHGEDVFERFRRVTAIMKLAFTNSTGWGSPNGSKFEITSSSRQAVSILQDLPPLKFNGFTSASDNLLAPWKAISMFDMSSSDFLWKFLMGTV